MNKLYYRGNAYDFTFSEVNANRCYTLFLDGKRMHEVSEEELDIRSRVSLILDAYYTSLKQPRKRNALA